MKDEKKIEMYIDDDEWYPVWILVPPRKELCEYFKRIRKKVKFTKVKLKEINDTMKKFKEIQKYLGDLTEK